MADPEYIVVGSGAGGGPPAARLAELGHHVLLLEAGGEDEPWTYQVPVFHGLATEDEAMRLDHYVRHYADEGRQRGDPKYEPARDGVLYPRARTTVAKVLKDDRTAPTGGVPDPRLGGRRRR